MEASETAGPHDDLALSVIVPSFNTRDLLADCLTSVERQRDVRMEIIVVDNASSDGSAAMVRERFPHVQLIENRENRGYSGGMNTGIRVARGALLVLLNSDTIVHDGTLRRVVDALGALENAGAACPRCLDGDGNLQSLGAKMMGPWDYLRRSAGLPVHEPPRDPELSCEIETPSGACLVITRRGIEALGQLDEELPLFLEEQDIARRLQRAGLRSFYVADAVVTHLGSQTVKLLDPGLVWQKTQGSYAHLYRKHFPPLTSLTLRSAAAANLVARMGLNLWRIAAGRGGPRTAHGRARFMANLRAIRPYLDPLI